MHEYTLLRSILRTVFACSAEHGNRRVVRVTLQVGAQRNVVPDVMRFAFEAATHATVAEGAALVWNEIALVVRCTACATEFSPAGPFWECPACGSFDACLLQGNELILESVELDGN